MARVLHVTECYGGGVGHAVRTIASLLPEHEHYLLWTGEEAPEPSHGFIGTVELPRSPLARVASVRQTVHDVQPDLVHAHSSWAGIYARALPQRVPVIYQPHAYIVAKPDLPGWKRGVYRTAERYLARHTDLVITLTAAEERLARSLSNTTPTGRVPNVSTIRPEVPVERCFSSLPLRPTVVTIARICEQKDPHFFTRVRMLVQQHVPGASFVWIGDGDEALKRELVSAGVRVTGWLQPDEMARELTAASLYLHTASYEGFPLSVLEAAAFGLPMVVRSIEAFDEVDLARGDSEQECADQLVAMLTDEASWQNGRDRTVALDADAQPQAQAAALDAIYARVCASGRLTIGGGASVQQHNVGQGTERGGQTEPEYQGHAS